MPEAALEEALQFVAAHPHVYLLGRRADGFPTGWAMTARVADRSVEFSTYRASAKVRNLTREGRAGILALDETGGSDLTLFLEGPVELAEEAAWATPRPDARWPAGRVPPVPAGITETVQRRHGDGKRVVLRVVVEQARFGRALA